MEKVTEIFIRWPSRVVLRGLIGVVSCADTEIGKRLGTTVTPRAARRESLSGAVEREAERPARQGVGGFNRRKRRADL